MIKENDYFFQNRKEFYMQLDLTIELMFDVIMSDNIKELSPRDYNHFNKEEIIGDMKKLGFSDVSTGVSLSGFKRYLKEKKGNIWIRIYAFLILKEKFEWLGELAKSYPDFFKWIENVHQYRNQRVHSHDSDKDMMLDEIDESMERLEGVLKIVLGIDNIAKRVSVDSEINERYIAAKNDVRINYKGDDEKLKEILINMEIGNTTNGRKSVEYLVRHYINYSGGIKWKSEPDLCNDKWRIEVKEKAVENGFTKYHEQFSKINKRQIPIDNTSLEKSSLGGMFAYLMMSDGNMPALAKINKNFFEDVGYIDDNTQSHSGIKKESFDIETFKETVYKVVEVFELFMKNSSG